MVPWIAKVATATKMNCSQKPILFASHRSKRDHFSKNLSSVPGSWGIQVRHLWSHVLHKERIARGLKFKGRLSWSITYPTYPRHTYLSGKASSYDNSTSRISTEPWVLAESMWFWEQLGKTSKTTAASQNLSTIPVPPKLRGPHINCEVQHPSILKVEVEESQSEWNQKILPVYLYLRHFDPSLHISLTGLPLCLQPSCEKCRCHENKICCKIGSIASKC